MNFYVYEHWNENGCFYVGCGSIKNNRANDKGSRSKEWYNQINNGYTVKIIKEFESRKEAFEFEEKLTMDHLKKGSKLVNKGIGTHLFGEANGMYRKGYLLKGKKKSKEHIEKIRKTIINNGSLKGENNPMFGISVKDRLKSEEEYNNWKKSCARKGVQNGNSIKIKVENLETKEVKILDCISDAGKYTKIPTSSISGATRNNKIFIRDNYRMERI